MPYCGIAVCLTAILCGWAAQVGAAGFVCAGSQGIFVQAGHPEAAAKPTRIAASTTGTRQALVLFARFKGEPANPVPSWAADFFNPDLPGSISHFYDTMSFGKLRLRGQVAPKVYESAQPASAYLASGPSEQGRFGQFAQEILRQADQDLDLARFDNDGPDGVPNSGDDDGAVDAVLIVMEKVPAGFLLGGATGIKTLGFEEPLATADVGENGSPIHVLPGQGTVQRGRNYAEAVGTICHEYGHVLGLPDLYNTDFLEVSGAGPEEDSAGVGAWCLMGWGAAGWNGNNGPNSLCAWSRVQLGWAEEVVVKEEHQDIRLEEVGKQGQVVRVPLTGQEHFLVEYRRRTSTYYDRNLPGEGLLIWRVGTRRLGSALASQGVVDLECADGRWRDAGYPLGKMPDALTGENNLDFWAHDEDYTRAHGGNLGDATDPFDGVRYTAFTLETNPSSRSVGGWQGVRVEGIRLSGQTASFKTQVSPLLLDIEGPVVGREEHEGVVMAGEKFALKVMLTNQGGVPAQQVRVFLHSDDPLIEILKPEAQFKDLQPGQQTFGADAAGGLQARFREDFVGTHTAQLSLELYANGQLMGRREVPAIGMSVQQTVQRLAVLDTLGNGDGLLQRGEIVSLELDLGEAPPALVERCRFSLRSLHGLVQLQGGGVQFEQRGLRTLSRVTPECLVPALIEPGTPVDFEFEVRSEFSAWKDTLTLQVHAGPDPTPPRVLELQTRFGPEGLYLSLPKTRIIEGSAVRAAQAIIYRSSDTTQVATFSLREGEQGFAGLWSVPPPGNYLLSGLVEDAAGNQGYSRLQPFSVLAQLRSTSTVFPGAWEALGFSLGQYRPVVSGLYLSPSQPAILYARADDGVWRSEDGGQSWERTGLMSSAASNSYIGHLLVDPTDPFTLYSGSGNYAKSRDGGQTWGRLQPGSPPVELLAIDPSHSGLIYGRQDGELVTSDDGGDSWREAGMRLGDNYPAFFGIHPANPRVLYAGELSAYSAKRGIHPGALGRSEDGGKTWEQQQLKRSFHKAIPDPHNLNGLYAVNRDTIWYSDSRGQDWVPFKVLGGGWGKSGPVEIEMYPRAPGVMVAWAPDGAKFVWKTVDQGRTWTQIQLPVSAVDLVFDPQDPARFYILNHSQQQLLYTSDNGQSWMAIALPQVGAPAGVLEFDYTGRLFAGSGNRDKRNRVIPMLHISSDGGWTWEKMSEWTGYNIIPGMALFVDLEIDPFNPRNMLGIFVSMLLRSTDGGKTWASDSRASLDTGYSYDLVPDPAQVGACFLIGSDAELRWSPDWGRTWEKRNRGLPGGSRSGSRSLAPDPSALGTVYAAIADSIWRSIDQGKHWEYFTRMAAGLSINQLAIHPQDAQRMYAATPEGLYLSQDRGNTWELLVIPAIGRGLRLPLRFDDRDKQRFYWITGPQLLETRDGGKTWRSLGDDLAGAPWFNDMAINPLDPEVIYAATTWGVYRLDTRTVVTAVEGGRATPETFALASNYPNPFNPTTTLRFTLPQAGEAELSIYNLLGQRVATLVKGPQEAGPHALQWDGRDDAGRELASGVYFYRLQAGAQVETRKLLLLR